MAKFFKNTLIARYQREALKELRQKGFILPDLQTIRKNFTLLTGNYGSTRERVFASVAAQGDFKMKKGTLIPGLEHFKNLKIQNRINNQIRANLKTVGAKASKYYKPFNIENISGQNQAIEKKAYDRAIQTMQGKNVSVLLGRYVGSYKGLITSIGNAFGKQYRVIRDIINILYGNLRVIEAQWTSNSPKLTKGVEAAVAFIQNIESKLPQGVQVKVMYSSDQVLMKTFIVELIEAVGLNPDDYKDEIMQIMRDTSVPDGSVF